LDWERIVRDFLSGNWLVILVVGVILAAFIFLRTPADKFASTGEFDTLVRSGAPTVVEFFSNT
jgi:hypothetical protein